MQNKPEQDRNQEATVYLGNLDERCTDALIWELMLQAGPVSNVFLPKDRISMAHQGFGFCEFLAEDDAEYAVKIMNQIKLFGKPIRVNKASYDKKQLDVGANLFIGNIDAGVDENQLYDTFSTFGAIAEHPKIARDASTGESKGYGFVSFLEFEAADMAVENMNGQFLGGKQVSVQYAFKKDGKGERHGTQAERLLAAQAKKQSFGGFAPTPAYVPPPVAAAPVAAPPPLPAGFAPANVIGAPPAAGAYGGYQQQYDQYGAYPQQQQYAQNGYAPPPPPQGYAGGGGGAPPPPPPIRMGFNQ
ncbi:Spliceosome-associated protein 49 [Vanrija albida]|uniref:Spliceosome-associated protein 49 n=1 Tax=Vanrija albida TaxID=181172 RepID=A0ABR3QAE1_9TREE